MAQEFDLGELDDEEFIEGPRYNLPYTVGPLYDEGAVGSPRFIYEYGPTGTTPVPGGEPTHTDTLPEVALQLVDLDHQHVGWLPMMKEGAACRGELTSPGAITTSLQRTDPSLADIQFEDRILRYWLRGELIAAAVISQRQDNTIATTEEAGQDAPLGGPGTLSILSEAVVEPWKLSWFPDLKTHRFNYAHPDYDPDDDGLAWVGASPKADGENTGILWTGYPVGWPDPLAQWIWGPLGTSSNAPPGYCYFRRTFTLTGPTREYVLLWGGDNAVEGFFIDGVEIGVSQNWQKLQRVEVKLSSGEHVFVSKVRNAIDDGPPGGNPAGFRMSLYNITALGSLGSVALRTDQQWSVLQYPPYEPGWTHGQVLNYLLDKQEALDGRVIVRTFTNHADSGGAAWPVQSEIAVQVGSTIQDAFEQFAENDIDIAMAPGSWTLHAWNKGGRGAVLPVTLAGPADVPDDEACLTSLSHQRFPALATSLLVRWEENWLRQEVAPPDGNRRRARQLQIPTVRSERQAILIADSVLDAYSRERVTYTAGVHPRNDTQVPAIAIQVGDHIELPDPDGALASVRVQAWSVVCDQEGQLTFDIEAGDTATQEIEKVETWLRRVADGALSGRTKQTMSDREDTYRWTASTLGLQPIPPFDRDADVTVFESKNWTAAAPGVIVELQADVPEGDTGTFELRQNGTGVAVVVNNAPSVQSLTTGLGIHYERGDIFSVWSDDVGFGVVITPRCV